MSIPVTVFTPPNGDQSVIEVKDITADDATWFIANNVKISMENLRTGDRAIYADWGKKYPDGEPIEEMVISNRRSCKEMMSDLRILTERAKANG